jgi:hypothetical protein
MEPNDWEALCFDPKITHVDNYNVQRLGKAATCDLVFRTVPEANVIKIANPSLELWQDEIWYDAAEKQYFYGIIDVGKKISVVDFEDSFRGVMKWFVVVSGAINLNTGLHEICLTPCKFKKSKKLCKLWPFDGEMRKTMNSVWNLGKTKLNRHKDDDFPDGIFWHSTVKDQVWIAGMKYVRSFKDDSITYERINQDEFGFISKDLTSELEVSNLLATKFVYGSNSELLFDIRNLPSRFFDKIWNFEGASVAIFWNRVWKFVVGEEKKATVMVRDLDHEREIDFWKEFGYLELEETRGLIKEYLKKDLKLVKNSLEAGGFNFVLYFVNVADPDFDECVSKLVSYINVLQSVHVALFHGKGEFRFDGSDATCSKNSFKLINDVKYYVLDKITPESAKDVYNIAVGWITLINQELFKLVSLLNMVCAVIPDAVNKINNLSKFLLEYKSMIGKIKRTVGAANNSIVFDVLYPKDFQISGRIERKFKTKFIEKITSWSTKINFALGKLLTNQEKTDNKEVERKEKDKDIDARLLKRKTKVQNVLKERRFNVKAAKDELKICVVCSSEVSEGFRCLKCINKYLCESCIANKKYEIYKSKHAMHPFLNLKDDVWKQGSFSFENFRSLAHEKAVWFFGKGNLEDEEIMEYVDMDELIYDEKWTKEDEETFQKGLKDQEKQFKKDKEEVISLKSDVSMDKEESSVSSSSSKSGETKKSIRQKYLDRKNSAIAEQKSNGDKVSTDMLFKSNVVKKISSIPKNVVVNSFIKNTTQDSSHICNDVPIVNNVVNNNEDTLFKSNINNNVSSFIKNNDDYWDENFKECPCCSGFIKKCRQSYDECKNGNVCFCVSAAALRKEEKKKVKDFGNYVNSDRKFEDDKDIITTNENKNFVAEKKEDVIPSILNKLESSLINTNSAVFSGNKNLAGNNLESSLGKCNISSEINDQVFSRNVPVNSYSKDLAPKEVSNVGNGVEDVNVLIARIDSVVESFQLLSKALNDIKIILGKKVDRSEFDKLRVRVEALENKNNVQNSSVGIKDEKKKSKKEKNIENYKKNNDWIDDEQWKSLNAYDRVMKRFIFSDRHQCLTRNFMNSLSAEQRLDFHIKKYRFRVKRVMEINGLDNESEKKKLFSDFDFFKDNLRIGSGKDSYVVRNVDPLFESDIRMVLKRDAGHWTIEDEANKRESDLALTYNLKNSYGRKRNNYYRYGLSNSYNYYGRRGRTYNEFKRGGIAVEVESKPLNSENF